MRRTFGVTGALLVLFALGSCASAPAPPQARTPVPTAAVTAGETAPPCHDPYVADIDTSVPGAATPVEAAAEWAAKYPSAPSGAPTAGWTRIDVQTVRSGDWIVGVSPTIPGGWVVSGLGCGDPQRKP
jgi:hypothetical protein